MKTRFMIAPATWVDVPNHSQYRLPADGGRRGQSAHRLAVGHYAVEVAQHPGWRSSKRECAIAATQSSTGWPANDEISPLSGSQDRSREGRSPPTRPPPADS